MRLWHYYLLEYLDDFHIVSQWRELLAIKGAIDKNGTPNHRLVNRILDYDITHFQLYTTMVVEELKKRNIKYDKNKYKEILNWNNSNFNQKKFNVLSTPTIFDGWHNNRYLKQCLYNLQEKYDCGIVSEDAWRKISEVFNDIL